MRIRTVSLLLAAGLASQAFAATGLQQVDTDVNGLPLDPSTTVDGAYKVLDTSANGRFVLLSNFTGSRFPDGASQVTPETDCVIYRKDTLTGELRNVFAGSDDHYAFCSNAKISRNGRYVVAPPIEFIDEPICEAPYRVNAALAVRKDLVSDEITEVRANFDFASSSDIARICSASPDYPISLPTRHAVALSGNGSVVVLRRHDIFNAPIDADNLIVDFKDQSAEPLNIRPLNEDPEAIVSVNWVALSTNGNRVAAVGTVNSPVCRPSCQLPYEPEKPSIYILNRARDTQRRPLKLSNLNNVRLNDNAWTAKGKRITWLEYPDTLSGSRCFWDANTQEQICESTDSCDANDCELKVHGFNLQTRARWSRSAEVDPATLNLCFENDPTTGAARFVATQGCEPRLSRSGRKLLLARAVRYPFGGSWQPDLFEDDNFVCVDKVSLENPSLEPQYIECPEPDYNGGPILPGQLTWRERVNYNAPITWYVLDLNEKHTTLVSITDEGDLYSSDGAWLTDRGDKVFVQSSDPRLQLTEGIEAAIEPDTDCTWSPGKHISNLALATNDNVDYYAEDEFVVFPATPITCLPTYPALPRQVFAAKVVSEVNLSTSTIKNPTKEGSYRTRISNLGTERATMVQAAVRIENFTNLSRPQNVYCDALLSIPENQVPPTYLCEIAALEPGQTVLLDWERSDGVSLPGINTGVVPSEPTFNVTVTSNEYESRPFNNRQQATF